jgi:hypothetical protein
MAYEGMRPCQGEEEQRPEKNGRGGVKELGEWGAGVTPIGARRLGSGPRGAPPLGWSHRQVSLYNICSLGRLTSQPPPRSGIADIPVCTSRNYRNCFRPNLFYQFLEPGGLGPPLNNQGSIWIYYKKNGMHVHCFLTRTDDNVHTHTHTHTHTLIHTHTNKHTHG